MNTREIMKKFVEPQSVAIIGATRKTGEFSLNVVEHLLAYGYSGRLYPINPNNVEDIAGVKAYANVADIEAPIDLAVIMTPREIVPGALKECADKGITCAVIAAQGFGDAEDTAGHDLNTQMKEIMRDTGIRVLGPNTLGTANAFINFSSSFVRVMLEKHPVGIICQSGTFYHGYPEFKLTGKGIDLGNACDIGFIEGLEYFEDDPEVRVIGMHIEGLVDIKGFFETARRVIRKKPVVVLKTGKSEQAAKAMQSHTGSLAGNTALWDTALKSAGIIRVNDMEELFDTVRLFSIAPLMKNNRIAIATYSGAAGIMALDSLQNSELEITDLPAYSMEKLQAMAPSWLRLGNPVDYWPIMMGHANRGLAMKEVMDILLSDDELGGVIYQQLAFTPQSGERLRMLLSYLASEHPDKPLIAGIPGPASLQCISAIQSDGKLVAYPSPERAARAFKHLWQYSRLRSVPE